MLGCRDDGYNGYTEWGCSQTDGDDSTREKEWLATHDCCVQNFLVNNDTNTKVMIVFLATNLSLKCHWSPSSDVEASLEPF